MPPGHLGGRDVRCVAFGSGLDGEFDDAAGTLGLRDGDVGEELGDEVDLGLGVFGEGVGGEGAGFAVMVGGEGQGQQKLVGEVFANGDGAVQVAAGLLGGVVGHFFGAAAVLAEADEQFGGVLVLDLDQDGVAGAGGGDGADFGGFGDEGRASC